jgi:hypothetical protein
VRVVTKSPYLTLLQRLQKYQKEAARADNCRTLAAKNVG